ncbi:MAG: ABC transporter permease [Planctomycetes bacterium]|nr:ABC transporter permease [Planctomycetota bacterium]
MLSFILRRLLAGALTLFVIATLCFFLIRFAPGNPFSAERQLSPEVRKNVEAYWGFDRPLWSQYLTTMGGYARLDLGPSIFYSDSTVSALLLPALRTSLTLGAIAFLLAVLLGLPLGVLGAARQHRVEDHVAMGLAVTGICIPNFLLGPLLMLVFCTWLHWLLPAGWPERWDRWEELQKLVLPAVTLSLVHVAYISRLGRAGMLDVLRKEFVRTARAKGLTEWRVVLKHALRNGVFPVLSYAGPMAALVVTGSVVVEKIFVVPGMGKHFVNAAFNRDHPVLMGAALIYSALVILFNLLVDLAYCWLDPRVRLE